jgi:hypothetical protein
LEGELLIQAVRKSFGNDGPELRRGNPSVNLNWDRFLILSEWHGVTSRVYKAFHKDSPPAVPVAVIRQLRAFHQCGSARGVALSEELARLLEEFARQHVCVYPFKGPALSAMIFGDPVVRPCRDLDLVIRDADLHRAIKIVRQLGYESTIPLDEIKLPVFRRVDCALPFVHKSKNTVIELHWAVVPYSFAFSERRLHIWEKLENRTFGNVAYPALPVEETLVLCAIHGTKHLWCKLGWVCDIAGLIAPGCVVNWERLVHLADRCGVRRIVLLSLLLARDLTGTQLPERIGRLADADSMIYSLARRVKQEVPHKAIGHDGDFGRYFFHQKARERRIDQARLAGRVMAMFALGEWNPRPLPDALYALSLFYRPIRLACVYGQSLLRAHCLKHDRVLARSLFQSKNAHGQ